LDLHYKADADTDHGVTFRGDRPTELADLVANLKKTSRVKHKPSGTTVQNTKHSIDLGICQCLDNSHFCYQKTAPV